MAEITAKGSNAVIRPIENRWAIRGAKIGWFMRANTFRSNVPGDLPPRRIYRGDGGRRIGSVAIVRTVQRPLVERK